MRKEPTELGFCSLREDSEDPPEEEEEELPEEMPTRRSYTAFDLPAIARQVFKPPTTKMLPMLLTRLCSSWCG